MPRIKLILADTVVGQLYQGISFYQNMNRLRLMGKASVSSISRNSLLIILSIFIFQNTGSLGLVLVALGASVLAYVALRMRVHSLDFVERRDGRFASPSRRKSYFDVLNVTDSIFGLLCIIGGFTLRITSAL